MNNIQRVLYFSKLVSKYNTLNLRCIPGVYSSTNKVLIKHYTSTNTVRTVHRPERESLIAKLMKKFSFFSISKSRLKVTGYLLFEAIADHINYPEIFEKLNLPDTFYSWFVITELYIWMVMVRYMAEGDDGREVRNRIIEALWTDVKHRVKKLGSTNPAGIRMQVSELSEQLHAAIIAYDEGLQSDDTVLAGALWRRLYQQKPADPEHLDALVKYVRRQIKLFDGLTNRELFEERCVKWEPFKL